MDECQGSRVFVVDPLSKLRLGPPLPELDDADAVAKAPASGCGDCGGDAGGGRNSVSRPPCGRGARVVRLLRDDAAGSGIVAGRSIEVTRGGEGGAGGIHSESSRGVRLVGGGDRVSSACG